MVNPCRLLYTNPPACDTTYANSLGAKYDAAQVIYALVTLVLTALTVYYSVKLYQKKKKLLPLDTQKLMFLLINIVCITLIIRAVDPFGWRDWIGLILLGQAYDWGSCAIFHVMLSLVLDWLGLILRVGGKTHRLKQLNFVFNALIMFIWVFYIVFSGLQADVDPSYLYRAIKLGVGTAFLLSFTLAADYYGLQIWLVLRASHKHHGAARPSNARLGSDGGTDERRLRKNENKINRIIKLLSIASAFLFLIIIWNIVTISNITRRKDTNAEPPDAPTSVGDIIAEALFDIAHMAAVGLVVFFFRPRDTEEEQGDVEEESESSRAGSRHAGPSRRGTAAASPLARANSATTTIVEEPLDSKSGGGGVVVTSPSRVALMPSSSAIDVDSVEPGPIANPKAAAVAKYRSSRSSSSAAPPVQVAEDTVPVIFVDSRNNDAVVL